MSKPILSNSSMFTALVATHSTPAKSKRASNNLQKRFNSCMDKLHAKYGKPIAQPHMTMDGTTLHLVE